MKFFCVILTVLLLLCGCSAEPTFETLGPVLDHQGTAEPKRISVLLPADAAATVMAGGNGKLYFCDGYEVMAETLEAGDIGKTLKSVTGYPSESMTVLETSVSEVKRYECAWTAVAETGDIVGRAVILDDGSYHYVLSVMAPAQEAGSLHSTWDELFASFALQG